jgi:hypothetical protein
MKELVIEGSKKTPDVKFLTDGKLSIMGRSIHEDPSKFYDPLVEWVEGYINAPQEVTTIDIKLEYFNSGSAKYILNILQLLSAIQAVGKTLMINWHYEEGDDDILERGEYYASILDTNFNFIQYD